MIEKSKSILDACMLAFLSISFGPYIISIMLVNWHGMVDATYYLWLFDENSGKYVFCPSFSKIKTPGLDKEKKEIVSEYHIGPSHFYYEKYKWRNGKFVMTYSKSEGEEF